MSDNTALVRSVNEALDFPTPDTSEDDVRRLLTAGEYIFGAYVHLTNMCRDICPINDHGECSKCPIHGVFVALKKAKPEVFCQCPGCKS